jgi:YD repeat-containing protein
LRYAYDLADRAELVTYPSGRQVRYVRDAKGRVSAVRTRASASVTAWTNIATGIGYEAFGPLKTMSLGNGERLIAGYGDDGRLDGRRLYKQADGTNISHLTYGYDNEDNITRITDRLDAANNLSFAYDPNGRLKRVTTASGAMRRTDYVFDANGNRVRVLTRALPDDLPDDLPEAAITECYRLA